MNALATASLARAWLLVALGFAMFPNVDIWVAQQFYVPALGGFYLDHVKSLALLREVIWNLFHLVALVVILFGLQAWYSNQKLEIPGRFWAFCASLIVLGPVLLVNLGFKAHWGRARPAQIDSFGGEAQFTPALQFADECARNCSFVSGEAAAATVSAIIAGLVLWNVVPPHRRRPLVVVLISFVVIGASLRVMKGRHFLSDVVWAALMMMTLAVWLGRLFRLASALPRVTAQALRNDAGLFWGDIRLCLTPALRELARLLRGGRRLFALTLGRSLLARPKEQRLALAPSTKRRPADVRPTPGSR